MDGGGGLAVFRGENGTCLSVGKRNIQRDRNSQKRVVVFVFSFDVFANMCGWMVAGRLVFVKGNGTCLFVVFMVIKEI